MARPRQYVWPFTGGPLVDLGVDQGWDVRDPSGGYVTAIANGHIVRVDYGPDYQASGQGWGQVVYYAFDKPVTINGVTHTGAYIAETSLVPGLQAGDPVKAGQPLAILNAAAGQYTGRGLTNYTETGFARGGTTEAPLGSSSIGDAFRSWLRSLTMGPPTAAPPPAQPPHGSPAPVPRPETPPSGSGGGGSTGGAGAGTGTGHQAMGATGSGSSSTDPLTALFESIFKIPGISQLEDFLGFIVWIFQPINWLRMVEFVVGIGLIMFGLGTLVRTFTAPGSPTERTGRRVARAPRSVATLLVKRGRGSRSTAARARRPSGARRTSARAPSAGAS